MGYVYKLSPDNGTTNYVIGSGLYGTSSTGASTAAKTVTCSDFDSFQTGVTIHVKFSAANSASSPTLNVNSKGAKNILPTDIKWNANDVISFTYDGTNWVAAGFYDTDTKNTAGSTDSSSKLFLIGATSQTASSQTYSDADVYATNGALVCATISTNGGTSNYELGAACEKAIGSVTTGDTGLVTGNDVAVAIASAVSGGNLFMGTVGESASTADYTQATIEALAYKAGMYWVVKDAGTYCGFACEPGDMLWCVKDKTGTTYSASDFNAIQYNAEYISNAEIDTIVAS